MPPPDDRMSALEIRRPAEGRRLPLLVHVPYAARALPPSARARLALSDAALRERLPEITDDLLDRVFALAPNPDATLAVNRVSRLALDPWDDGAGRTGAAAPDAGPRRLYLAHLRAEVRAYTEAHRLPCAGLPRVRRVAAWHELEIKPWVGVTTPHEARGGWVVCYDRDPARANDAPGFALIDRVTGASGCSGWWPEAA